jgi:hypothetical protein
MRIALRSCIPLALTVAACAHSSQLAPAPNAQTVPGNPRVAEETVDGVRVVVDSTAWRSGTVHDVLVPVKVTIDDNGKHRLRIAYSEFTLGGASGFRLAALPPYQVAANNASVVQPGFFGRRYFLTPWASRFYDWPGVWQGPFPLDVAYYNQYYAAWPASLPDRDVLRQALPEGVLEPGGEASGFLYFADQPKGTQLTFLMSLIDADLGQSIGTVAIPFVVK